MSSRLECCHQPLFRRLRVHVLCVCVSSCVTSCAALSPCPQVTSACDIFPKGLSQSAEREFSCLPICSDCVIFDLFTSVGLQHIARKFFEYYCYDCDYFGQEMQNMTMKESGLFKITVVVI